MRTVKNSNAYCSNVIPIALFICFSVAVIGSLPTSFVLKSDDFGYAQALYETLNKGRLSGSEWLAPLNIVPVVLQSAVFLLTENFYVATYGLACSLYLCATWVFFVVLLHSGSTKFEAASIAIAIFAHPLFLHKATDFTGFSTYVFFFLLSLLSASRSTCVFYGCAILAFLTRQSAVVLLILPVLLAIFNSLQAKSIAASVLRSVGVFAVFIMVDAIWPKGLAARGYADPLVLLSSFSLSKTIYVSALCLLLASPFAAAISSLSGDGLRRRLQNNISMKAVLFLAASLYFLYYIPGEIREENPFRIYHSLVFISLPCIFLIDIRGLRPNPYLLTAAVASLSVSLREDVWDYYLIEILILIIIGYVGNLSNQTALRLNTKDAFLPQLALGLAIVVTVFTLSLQLAVSNEAGVVKYNAQERSIRRGGVLVEQLVNSTFGHYGWYLFDYYALDHSDPDVQKNCLLCFRKLENAKYLNPGRDNVKSCAPTSNKEWIAFIKSDGRRCIEAPD